MAGPGDASGGAGSGGIAARSTVAGNPRTMLLLSQTRQVLEPVCPGLRPLLRGLAGGVDLQTPDVEKQQRQLVEETETGPEGSDSLSPGMTEGHDDADADANVDAGASREDLMVEGEIAGGRRGREFKGATVAFVGDVAEAVKVEPHGDGGNSNGVTSPELSKSPEVAPSELEIQSEKEFDRDAKESARGSGAGEVFDGPGGGSRRGSGGIEPLARWIGGLQIV